MTALLALSAIQHGYSVYNSMKQQQAAVDAINDRNLVAQRLASEALAITYNSILNKSFMEALKARRAQEGLMQQGRSAEGAALVQAAVTGATGRRVDVSRNLRVKGGLSRAMTKVERDAYNEQASLIDRADMEERAMMNRLLSTMENMPSSFDPVMADLGAGIDVYKDYMDEKAYQENRKENLLSSTAASGYTTGTLQLTQNPMARK